MTDTRTEALRLADSLDRGYDPTSQETKAAAELRRLDAANKELLEALKDMRNAFIGSSIEVQADALRKARAVIAKHGGQQ